MKQLFRSLSVLTITVALSACDNSPVDTSAVNSSKQSTSGLTPLSSAPPSASTGTSTNVASGLSGTSVPGTSVSSTYVYTNEIRLLYLSLRNIEPDPASTALKAFDQTYRLNPTAATLLSIRGQLVDQDSGISVDIINACNNIGTPDSSCTSQMYGFLKGGVNFFDAINMLYMTAIAVNGSCPGVRVDIGKNFAIIYGVTPACAQWQYLSQTAYASLSSDQARAQMLAGSYIDTELNGYLAARGKTGDIGYWSNLVHSGQLSMLDARIGIQVYE